MSAVARPQDASETQAIPLLCAFPLDKLPLLLQRILAAHTASAFTMDEERQLGEMCGLTEAQVTALLKLLHSIFAEAGRRRLASPVLAQELQALGVASATCDIMTQLWVQEQTKYEAVLVERSSHHAPTLLEAQWRLHVTMADTATKGTATPTALFHIKQSDGEGWHMQMDHGELHQFLTQLDAIQDQLDALAAAP
ncbi:hypothetical protein ACHHYP_01318 [Achlya hypogyna]|uniref:COMM domain-containing protein n=1 Tax=Achlya hypogyna TaxID=1202772 RepID=A0A1V9Z8T2_ACHHY|nr:hypothetical protein ACHHYP_01318 [Achlya hypogyna]